MFDITRRRVEDLIRDAMYDAGLHTALGQTLTVRTRLEGLHANVVSKAIRYGLTCFETVEFPDAQGAWQSSEKLHSRRVLCFTPEASKLLGEYWRSGVELQAPLYEVS